MYVYVYDHYQGGREGRRNTERLVRRCAEMYIMEERLPVGTVSSEILRAPKGKPYFKELPLDFSVSHTGSLWVCAMDTRPVGIDVQAFRKCRYAKIAKRYYTSDEQEYVSAMGEAGFFRIWTRKEAYAKYTGEGLTNDMKKFSTLKNDVVDFVDFDIRQGVKGSCCMKEKRELWIRNLM